MKLRTITVWALYDPKAKSIVDMARFKYKIEMRMGCVLVKMKGHYVLPPGDGERGA